MLFFFISPSPRIQKTHQSALQVQQKAEALLQANHYDMDMIRDCAEKVSIQQFHTSLMESMNSGRGDMVLKVLVVN